MPLTAYAVPRVQPVLSALCFVWIESKYETILLLNHVLQCLEIRSLLKNLQFACMEMFLMYVNFNTKHFAVTILAYHVVWLMFHIKCL